MLFTRLLLNRICNLSNFRHILESRLYQKFLSEDLMPLIDMITFHCLEQNDVKLTSTLYKLLRNHACMLPLVNDKQLSQLLFSNKRFSQLSESSCNIEKFYLNAVKLVTGNKSKKTNIAFKTYRRESLERSVGIAAALLPSRLPATKKPRKFLLQRVSAAIKTLVFGKYKSSSDSGYASSYAFTSSDSSSYVSKDIIAGKSSIADVDDLGDYDSE